MTFTVKQLEGIEKFSNFLSDPKAKEFRLVGFSGCGKSYLSTALIAMINKKADLTKELGGHFPYEIQLTATTNKAAKALADSLGEHHPLYNQVSTIQSYLSLVLVNDYSNGTQKLVKGKNYKVKRNVICFIDEASYADTHLMQIIHESFIDSKIVFIGDPDQLLPVFHNVAPAFIEAPSVFLDETVRQAKGSTITTLGHAFRTALTTDVFPDIMEYVNGVDIEYLDGLTFKAKVDELFTSQEYKDNPNFCKILGWTNNRVQEYNAYIRSLYTDTRSFVEGEYVVANQAMMVSGVTAISNESIRKIHKASDVYDLYGIQVQTLTLSEGHFIVPLVFSQATALIKSYAKAKDWQTYFQLKEELCDFRPNHALTVHKSQGSTYDNVFIDLSDIGKNTQRSEIARLMYVGSTRASKKLYLYGALPKRLY